VGAVSNREPYWRIEVEKEVLRRVTRFCRGLLRHQVGEEERKVTYLTIAEDSRRYPTHPWLQGYQHSMLTTRAVFNTHRPYEDIGAVDAWCVSSNPLKFRTFLVYHSLLTMLTSYMHHADLYHEKNMVNTIRTTPTLCTKFK
jgi:hypothetical protein